MQKYRCFVIWNVMSFKVIMLCNSFTSNHAANVFKNKMHLLIDHILGLHHYHLTFGRIILNKLSMLIHFKSVTLKYSYSTLFSEVIPIASRLSPHSSTFLFLSALLCFTFNSKTILCFSFLDNFFLITLW